MSATAFQVITIDAPNPAYASGVEANTFHRLNASDTFYLPPSTPLQTLSTTNANGGTDIQGLLYVPSLPSSSACNNGIPSNVTHQSNMPRADDYLIGLAPWGSPNCVQQFLAAAKGDPVKAMLFYLPNNGTSAAPEPSSSVWMLGDGDAWKKQNPFPVYAIPGRTGDVLMQASAQYSGNMTDVPHGHELTEYLDSRDYVRLYAEINTGGGTTLPSLWVFLLVVLGILLCVIGFTSLSMHLLQRRRRINLRRRVASGEVDLEALGIKRLTVPQEVLDQMPLYVYGSGAPVTPKSTAREETTAAAGKLSSSPSSSRPSSPLPTTRPTPALIRAHSYHPTPLDQPTCAICLDDFVPASTTTTTSNSSTPAAPQTEGTIVRELPCHHIFHPSCVDIFLRDNSSLCPMCKKTALPRGYCPRVVTNAMVRRERMVRQIRPQEDVEGGRLRGLVGRRWFSAPPPTETGGEVQMSSVAPVVRRQSTMGRRVVTEPLPTSSAAPAEGEEVERIRSAQPPQSASRREWARQRAIAMLGRDRVNVPLDPDAEEAARTAGWKRVVGRVFPWSSGGGGGRAS